MGSRHFSITEISALVHERYPSPPDAEGAKFTIPDIIGALLGMAQSDHFRVSFVRDSDAAFEHNLCNHQPYKTAEEAAKAAKSHDDFQDKHYTVVRSGDGWGIRNVTAGHDDWRTYWEIKDEMKADGRRMTAEDYCELGDFILVFQDEWTGFANGGFFRAWIKENAPLTEERVQSNWLGSLKAKPAGLTTEARARGGRQPRFDLSLLEAIQRVIVDLTKDGILPSSPRIWDWLREQGHEDNPYEFDPLISGCDIMYVNGDTLHFQDQVGNQRERKRRSLARIIHDCHRI